MLSHQHDKTAIFVGFVGNLNACILFVLSSAREEKDGIEGMKLEACGEPQHTFLSY